MTERVPRPDTSLHHSLLWLQNSVPGFAYAYTHDAQFKAIIDNQLRLMQLQVELMVVGSQTRQAQLDAEVRRIERQPPTGLYENRPLTKEDLIYGRDNPWTRDTP